MKGTFVTAYAAHPSTNPVTFSKGEWKYTLVIALPNNQIPINNALSPTATLCKPLRLRLLAAPKVP